MTNNSGHFCVIVPKIGRLINIVLILLGSFLQTLGDFLFRASGHTAACSFSERCRRASRKKLLMTDNNLSKLVRTRLSSSLSSSSTPSSSSSSSSTPSTSSSSAAVHSKCFFFAFQASCSTWLSSLREKRLIREKRRSPEWTCPN